MEKDLKHTLAALLLAASTCLTQAATPMSGFAGNPEVVDFARDLEQREGFNAEQFGQAWVSLRVRDLFVPGEDFMQVAEYDPMDFAKRMRVRNATTPKPPAQGVGPVGFHALQAGTPGARLGAHHIRPDGNAEQYRKGAP